MTYACIIEKEDDDKLKKVEYRYWQRREMEMELDWIIHYERPTRRHGWKAVRRWSRLNMRYNQIKMERYEPPQWVKDAVRKKVNDALQFC